MKLLIAVLTMFALTSCATMSPTKTFLITNQQFTDALTQYNTMYELQNADTQAAWRAKIDPVALKANTALNLWKAGLNAGTDVTTYIDQWNAVKPELFALLINIGIVVED